MKSFFFSNASWTEQKSDLIFQWTLHVFCRLDQKLLLSFEIQILQIFIYLFIYDCPCVSLDAQAQKLRLRREPTKFKSLQWFWLHKNNIETKTSVSGFFPHLRKSIVDGHRQYSGDVFGHDVLTSDTHHFWEGSRYRIAVSVSSCSCSSTAGCGSIWSFYHFWDNSKKRMRKETGERWCHQSLVFPETCLFPPHAILKYFPWRQNRNCLYEFPITFAPMYSRDGIQVCMYR